MQGRKYKYLNEIIVRIILKNDCIMSNHAYIFEKKKC